MPTLFWPRDAQVAILARGAPQNLGAAFIAKLDAKRVEEIPGGDAVAESLETFGEPAGQAVDALRDRAQTLRAVIDGIHRSHDREQHLRRADVARRLVAADVLLARLEREAISRAACGIVRDADEPAGHLAFVFIARGEEGGVRSAEAERNAEALRAADGDIGAEFARRLEERERENIGGDDGERAGGVRVFDERLVVDDAPSVVGYCRSTPKIFVGKLKGFVIADDDFDAERLRARLHDLDGLRMAASRNEESVAPARDRVTERHRFGGGGGFVEQRGVGDIERGEVGDHRLEIEQRFEPALRDLGLIRRVGGVPAGIFENVALDDRRDDAVGITGANEAADDFVFARDCAQLGKCLLLGAARGQIERIR